MVVMCRRLFHQMFPVRYWNLTITQAKQYLIQTHTTYALDAWTALHHHQTDGVDSRPLILARPRMSFYLWHVHEVVDLWTGPGDVATRTDNGGDGSLSSKSCGACKSTQEMYTTRYTWRVAVAKLHRITHGIGNVAIYSNVNRRDLSIITFICEDHPQYWVDQPGWAWLSASFFPFNPSQELLC